MAKATLHEQVGDDQGVASVPDAALAGDALSQQAVSAVPAPAANAETWVFEPHGGYGGNDPDGERWPFGYITSVEAIMPLFEIAPIVCLDAEELHYAALKMAAAPQLLEVATRMLSYAQSGAAFNYPLGSLQELEIAVAKATGKAVSK